MDFGGDFELLKDFSIDVKCEKYTLVGKNSVIFIVDLKKPNGTVWQTKATEENLAFVAAECIKLDKKKFPKLPKRKKKKLTQANILMRAKQIEEWLKNAMYIASSLEKGSFMRAFLQLDNEGRYTPPARKTDINKRAIAAVKANYDYNGETDFDLPFKAGDVISVIENDDPHWWKGKIGMRIGTFPSSYVEHLGSTGAAREMTDKDLLGESAKSKPKEALLTVVRATCDYDAQDHTEISFRTGDVIGVVAMKDDNWWKGAHKNGSTGLFPVAYTEDAMGGARPAAAAPTPVGGGGGAGLGPPPPVPGGRQRPKSMGVVSARALYEYAANNADELTMREGDSISVTDQSDPEWWSGINNSTGASGVFPASYVEVGAAPSAPPPPPPTAYGAYEEEEEEEEDYGGGGDEGGYLVTVTFDRPAEAEGELDLYYGATISILEDYGDGWGYGRDTESGYEGALPLDHTEYL